MWQFNEIFLLWQSRESWELFPSWLSVLVAKQSHHIQLVVVKTTTTQLTDDWSGGSAVSCCFTEKKVYKKIVALPIAMHLFIVKTAQRPLTMFWNFTFVLWPTPPQYNRDFVSYTVKKKLLRGFAHNFQGTRTKSLAQFKHSVIVCYLPYLFEEIW